MEDRVVRGKGSWSGKGKRNFERNPLELSHSLHPPMSFYTREKAELRVLLTRRFTLRKLCADNRDECMARTQHGLADPTRKP